MSKCPTCGSPSPERHPATQHEGEVLKACFDSFHDACPTASTIKDMRLALSAQSSREKELVEAARWVMYSTICGISKSGEAVTAAEAEEAIDSLKAALQPYEEEICQLEAVLKAAEDK